MKTNRTRCLIHDKTKLYNQNYKDDLRVSVQLNAYLLKSIGMWPKSSGHSWIETLYRRTLNVSCCSLLVLLIIPSIIYLLEIKNLYDQMKIGASLSFFIMNAMKYCTMIVREADIHKCMEYIEHDWKSVRYKEDRKIMLKNANFGRRLVIICGCFMYGGVLFYYMALPLTHTKIIDEDDNLTYSRLMFPISKRIIDTRLSPINEIFHFVQLLTGFIAHNIAVTVCGLAALFAMHACGQLQVLVSCMNHLVDGREDVNDTVDERLTSVIQLHVRILNFISLIEDFLHEISLVEVVGSTINICFLGYFCMVEWDFQQLLDGLTYLTLCISIIFNIFIFCYIGELLTEQVVKVRENSYMIDWYRLPKKRSLSIILIICMSDATGKLTAGNLLELSICSFGEVIRASLMYLNILRTLMT